MSKLSRRQVTALLGGGLLAPLATPSIARAASSQPIFIVVPYAGGGTIDNLIRTVAKSMSETLQRPATRRWQPALHGLPGHARWPWCSPSTRTAGTLSRKPRA